MDDFLTLSNLGILPLSLTNSTADIINSTLSTSALTSFASSSSGPEYYVATYGSDNNPGTFDRPFATLSQAISRISDGQGGQIYLRGGLYHLSQGVVVDDEHDGGEFSPLVIQPYQNEAVILDGSWMDTTEKYGICIGGDYVNLIGLEVQNMPGDGICVQDANDVQILNNIVHDTDFSGIYISGSPFREYDRNYYIYVDGNTVYQTNLNKGDHIDDPTVNWGMGIAVGFSDYVFVTNNQVYQNYGEGIGFYVSTHGIAANNIVYDNFALGIYLDNASYTSVYNNFIYSTGDPAFFRGGAPSNGIQLANETFSFMQYAQSDYYLYGNAIVNNVIVGVNHGISYSTYRGLGNGNEQNLYGLRNTLIANNTIYNPDDQFIRMDEDPNIDDVMVVNNIFARDYSITWMADIPDVGYIVFSHNLWFGGDSVGGDQSILSPTDIRANPEFLMPGGFEGWNYQLNSTSPAIDAGTDISDVDVDYFNDPRPFDNMYDLGAIEFTWSTLDYLLNTEWDLLGL